MDEGIAGSIGETPDGQGDESRGRLTKERINTVDAKYPSPRARAEAIHGILQKAEQEWNIDFSHYDLICFSVQYLGAMALGALADDSRLQAIAKVANQWLHQYHYFHAETIFGGEDDNEDRREGPDHVAEGSEGVPGSRAGGQDHAGDDPGSRGASNRAGGEGGGNE